MEVEELLSLARNYVEDIRTNEQLSACLPDHITPLLSQNISLEAVLELFDSTEDRLSIYVSAILRKQNSRFS